jgi:NAD+ synthase (glutamine-hydrolysing)
VQQIFHKQLLPTYDVFDEDRYFERGSQPVVLELNGWRLGISICEDLWNDADFWRKRGPRLRYRRDPIAKLCQQDVAAVINLSASPFAVGKPNLRAAMVGSMAAKYRVPFLYVNQVGSNDDLIFDGHSFACDSHGLVTAQAAGFRPDMLLFDLAHQRGTYVERDAEPTSEIWRALVLGVRDYVVKAGFRKVLLGLSGGIDSTLVAAIAADALGGENVLGVLMPSPYSSDHSVQDALALAQNLGMPTYTLPIAPAMQAYDQILQEPFTGLAADITEENIQARIRGTLLMALSNKFGHLLLTTGNKSEMAVGYCTLYGDMCGALAVIGDVYKTRVYDLARWYNDQRGWAILPLNTLHKAPSAELRPNQTDQDSLPPYELLDRILYLHIERLQSGAEIIAQGIDAPTVQRVLRLMRIAEFKRKQAAPVLKVTERAFSSGWRLPIVKRDWEA